MSNHVQFAISETLDCTCHIDHLLFFSFGNIKGRKEPATNYATVFAMIAEIDM